jgi:hypothetical protein
MFEITLKLIRKIFKIGEFHATTVCLATVQVSFHI